MQPLLPQEPVGRLQASLLQLPCQQWYCLQGPELCPSLSAPPPLPFLLPGLLQSPLSTPWCNKNNSLVKECIHLFYSKNRRFSEVSIKKKKKKKKPTISAFSLATCNTFSFSSSSLLRSATDSDASFSFSSPVFILNRSIKGTLSSKIISYKLYNTHIKLPYPWKGNYYYYIYPSLYSFCMNSYS